jgi:hypothetical protein
MSRFRDYLLSRGVASVSCFNWSGGILRGLRGIDATAYAANLLEDYRRALREGTRLSIVSKSLGGLIAEKALALLQDAVQVHILLRVGVPDVRPALGLTNVAHVMNVTSRDDLLFRLGKHVVPYFVDGSAAGGEANTENVQLQGLSHYGLTEHALLRDEAIPDATTYDLYWRLLNRG